MKAYRMSLFYRAFPILDALRTELMWTHYSNSELTAYQIAPKSKQVLPSEKDLGDVQRGILECGDMSPLSDAATRRGEAKRGRVRALQRKGNAR